MTKEEFEKVLINKNVDKNSVQFALQCFELGRKSEQNNLCRELRKMPLNDTANSIALWILEQP